MWWKRNKTKPEPEVNKVKGNEQYAMTAKCESVEYVSGFVLNYYKYYFKFQSASRGEREYQGSGGFVLHGDVSDLFKVGEVYIVGMFSSDVQPVELTSFEHDKLNVLFIRDMDAVIEKYKKETTETNKKNEEDLARARGIPCQPLS